MSVALNPRVVAAQASADYALVLTFDNGERRLFDAKPFLQAPVFHALANPAYFAAVKADHGTVMWPGEEDFCPDTLWLNSQPLTGS